MNMVFKKQSRQGFGDEDKHHEQNLINNNDEITRDSIDKADLLNCGYVPDTEDKPLQQKQSNKMQDIEELPEFDASLSCQMNSNGDHFQKQPNDFRSNVIQEFDADGKPSLRFIPKVPKVKSKPNTSSNLLHQTQMQDVGQENSNEYTNQQQSPQINKNLIKQQYQQNQTSAQLIHNSQNNSLSNQPLSGNTNEIEESKASLAEDRRQPRKFTTKKNAQLNNGQFQQQIQSEEVNSRLNEIELPKRIFVEGACILRVKRKRDVDQLDQIYLEYDKQGTLKRTKFITETDSLQSQLANFGLENKSASSSQPFIPIKSSIKQQFFTQTPSQVYSSQLEKPQNPSSKHEVVLLNSQDSEELKGVTLRRLKLPGTICKKSDENQIKEYCMNIINMKRNQNRLQQIQGSRKITSIQSQDGQSEQQQQNSLQIFDFKDIGHNSSNKNSKSRNANEKSNNIDDDAEQIDTSTNKLISGLMQKAALPGSEVKSFQNNNYYPSTNNHNMNNQNMLSSNGPDDDHADDGDGSDDGEYDYFITEKIFDGNSATAFVKDKAKGVLDDGSDHDSEDSNREDKSDNEYPDERSSFDEADEIVGIDKKYKQHHGSDDDDDYEDEDDDQMYDPDREYRQIFGLKKNKKNNEPDYSSTLGANLNGDSYMHGHDEDQVMDEELAANKYNQRHGTSNCYNIAKNATDITKLTTPAAKNTTKQLKNSLFDKLKQQALSKKQSELGGINFQNIQHEIVESDDSDMN
eukprot:403360522